MVPGGIPTYKGYQGGIYRGCIPLYIPWVVYIASSSLPEGSLEPLLASQKGP